MRNDLLRGFVLPTPSSLNDVPRMFSLCAGRLESLGKAAFEERDHESWEAAQMLLYEWNQVDFFNRGNTTTPAYNLMMLLRNLLVSCEQAALARLEPVQLECRGNFTPERAMEEIRVRAGAHRILTHPFLLEFGSKGLPPALVTEFLENWHTDSDVFHLFIASLSLVTPFHLRGELYQNLFEELGKGDIEMAHPTIYRRGFRRFGRARDFAPLVESMHVFNTQVYYTRLCGDYAMGLGSLGFIEYNVPRIMEPLYRGLCKSGIPEEDIAFWPLHIETDKEHGEAWTREMLRELDSPERARSMLEGGLRTLEARAVMFDGLWARGNMGKEVAG